MNTYLIRNLYQPEICKKISIKKFPWGWKSPYNVKKLKNLNKNYEYKLPEDFKIGCIQAYLTIFNSFICNDDFLKFNYTNPNLSNVLNNIRTKTDLKKIEKKIKNISCKIINIENVINEPVYKNDKLLGIYDYEEIIHQLSTGIIGPEITHIWDQTYSKIIIRVEIKSDNYLDIVDFEKDLMYMNSDWQICNINEIIVKK